MAVSGRTKTKPPKARGIKCHSRC